MRTLACAGLMLAMALLSQPLAAQDMVFDYATLQDGLDAARESDKLVMVFLHSEANGGIGAYDAIWAHPLTRHYIDDMVTKVAIDAASEEGEEFVRHLKRRLKVDAANPGIYFFSNTGRSLINVQGPLTGSEAPGRVLLALGAADYAQHDDQRYTRRFSRWH